MDCAARSACVIGQLPAALREEAAALVRERTFRKGEVLQEQGELASRLAVMKVGSAVVLRESGDGEHRAVGFVGRGRVLGTFALLGESNALGCVAVSAGRLCELDLAAARGPGSAQARLRGALMRALVRDFALLADWAQVMRIRNTRGQLFAALQLLAVEQGSRRIRLPSRTALAELLGTTRETVVRNLRALESSRRLLRRDRWHCELPAGEPAAAQQDRID